jgi:hypothetical protein
MAAALDYFDQHPTPYLGFSFWLQMIGWIVSFIGAALYACTGCYHCNNYTITKPVAAAVAVAVPATANNSGGVVAVATPAPAPVQA